MKLINVDKQEERALASIQKKKPVIFYGEAGIGKTSLARKIAKDKDLDLIEVNVSEERLAEDYDRLLRKLTSKTIFPTMFLFDEIDGYKDFGRLNTLLSKSIHPIICTCNEFWKIPKYVQKTCETIRFYNPSKTNIVEYMKDENIEGNYDKASYDVRNTLISVNADTEPYLHLNNFDVTKAIIQGKFQGNFNDKFYIWILCNVTNAYKGIDVIKALNILCMADKMNKPEMLRFLPRGTVGDIEYPYYFTRLKVYKQKKIEEAKNKIKKNSKEGKPKKKKTIKKKTTKKKEK